MICTRQCFESVRVRLEIDVARGRLINTTVVPLGLIVNELVTIAIYTLLW
jgi:two-component sensor histidine kinase